MKAKQIAIIGASYLQLPLIEKAKEMGYTTHVFAWAADDVGEKEADYFYPISIVEKDKILEKCREIGICGICSIASDLASITVNYVANALSLPGNSMETALKSTNKHEMRKAFEAAGDPSPKSILVTDPDAADCLDVVFPVIVKPTDRSGSRGIFKIERKEDLKSAILSAMESGFEHKALVEEYVDGKEYSVEFISYHGEHHFLAMTLKYTTGAPNFIETGHLEPAPVDEGTLYSVINVVRHALDTLGITDGASHSEIKISEDGTIKIIEIGGRMGGDCIGSDLVRLSTGYDYVRMVIQVACGIEPDFEKVCPPHPAGCRFIFSQADIDELSKIQKEDPDKIIKVVDYHPEMIGHITDSSNRAGCYIFRV